MIFRALAALSFSFTLAAPALAAKCGGSFNVFLAGMARDAEAQGFHRASSMPPFPA